MAFVVPSSPPSTPDSKGAANGRGSNRFAGLASGPSTTPAGPPPPSSAPSFTPAGPPPSTIFGSSQLGSQKSLFGSQANGNANKNSPLFANTTASKKAPLFGEESASAPRNTRGNDSELIPPSRPSQPFQFHLDDGNDGDDEDDVDLPGRRQAPSDQDMDLDDQRRTESKTSDAMSLYDWAQHGTSVRSTKKQRRSPKATRGGVERVTYSALYSNSTSRAKLKPSTLPALAKSTAAQLGTAELIEPHPLILETEQEIRRIYPESNHLQDQDELLEAALRVVPETLAKAWQRCCKEEGIERESDGEFDLGIGPGDDAPPYHKASFIGNFILRLHHPPAASGKQAIPSFRASRPNFGRSSRFEEAHRDESYPKMLLSWLNDNHNPYAELAQTIASYQPSATAHPNFWDVLLSLTVRGRLNAVARFLTEANFENAYTTAEDGFGRDGYPANVLHMIDREVQHATETLNACPGVTDDEWDLRSYAWSEYRQKVEVALRQLTATSERVGTEPTESAFDASRLTLRSSVSEFAKSRQQIDVKMPRTVFRSLQELYKVILGKTNEILAAAQDWVEATIALTAWWDGEDEEEGLYSLSASQSNQRLVDIDPGKAYRKRLAEAFERATGQGDGLDDTWQIDSNNPVEIALGTVFEGNVQGVLQLLQAFSLPIASAVAEIGFQGRWFTAASAEDNAKELDNSDLMVLSYGQFEKPLTRNDLLSIYADHLCEFPLLEWSRTAPKEGWELAIEILSRIDNYQVADAKIGELISGIEVESDQRADKLIQLCRTFDLENEANRVSEEYADSVAETSDKYGTALIYYARAHNSQKVRNVLALLISYCLVHSTAFPTVNSLDPHLGRLLSAPRQSLQWLASLDPRAAELLSVQMSGYATLRTFYDIRDEALNTHKGRLSFTRKKAAATALLAVVSSAASSLQGGLYDPQSDAVVPVDGLLVLLGETLPFVDASVRYLSLRQLLVLLRAVEDVQTVHFRARATIDACLRSALAADRGGAAYPPTPLAKSTSGLNQIALQKSTSGLTGSSGFSLVGGSTDATSAGGAAGAAGAKERGWDWRKGLQAGDSGDALVGMLRLGLAREVARAWLDGEEL